MAPSADPQQYAAATAPEHFVDPFKAKRLHTHYSKHGPLPSNHTLDHVKSVELTPVIGTEFCDVNVLDWMNASNSDDLIRELARIISVRGVVVFRAQDDMTEERQKDLVQRLGILSGKPASSGLHIHPLLNTKSTMEHGRVQDKNIGTISSKLLYSLYGVENRDTSICTKRQTSAQMWHSDCAFEVAPADYASLRMTELPETGGDTIFASTYEIYDRISPPLQEFLSSLTATFGRPDFHVAAQRSNIDIFSGERGSPNNVGSELVSVHPVIRTNPVTGWRSVFPVGQHVRHINGVTPEESDMLLKYLLAFVLNNHDLQVRLFWKKNDLVLFDNRCSVHTATLDYEGLSDRFGARCVGIGEVPFLDPMSRSRREDLALKGEKIAGYFPNRR